MCSFLLEYIGYVRIGLLVANLLLCAFVLWLAWTEARARRAWDAERQAWEDQKRAWTEQYFCPRIDCERQPRELPTP